MKKLLIFAIILFALSTKSLLAQTTNLTLQVTDSGAQAWNNGTWTVTLSTPPGIFPYGPPFYNINTTTPVPNQSQTGTLSGTGSATMTLTQNVGIAPAQSQWLFQICPQVTGASCFTQFVIITSTTTLTLTPPVPSVNAGPGVVAYLDSEIKSTLGQTYFNVVSNALRICLVASGTSCSSWANVSGSGGAVSFSLLGSGTNTSAAMLVGTGASLGTTGSGTLTATTMPWAGLTSFPSGCTNQVITLISTTPTCTSLTTAFLPTSGTWSFGGTLSGNMTVSGNNAFTGTNTMSSFNNDLYVDGVHYPFTQAGVQQAFSDACTNNLSQGGTVHIVGRGVVIPLANQSGQLLLSTCPLRIEGDGGEPTFFSVASGISSSIPAFRLMTTSDTLFYEIKNIEVGCTSGCPTAGDAFLIDSGGGSNPGPSAVRFDHVRVTNGSLNGFDVNETGSGTNFQFEHHLQDSYFESGGVNINTVSADEQFIEHNIFNMGNATNPCISITQQLGASHALVLGNWMACGGGYVVIHQAIQPQIAFDQMDSANGQVGCTETNSAMIDVIGDVSAVYGAQIHNNNLNAHTFCHNNIQFSANSTNWLAMANVFSVNTANSVGACGINIVAGGTGGIIGPNVWFPGGTGYAYVCGDTAAAKVRLFANSATGEPDTRSIAPSDTDNAIVARGNSATQSADLIRVESSAGVELSSFDAVGRLRAPFGAQGNCGATGMGFLGATTTGFNWFSASTLLQGCISGTSVFTATQNRINLGNAFGYGWASTADPTSAGQDTGISRISAGITQADTSTVGNGLGSYQASGFLPHSAGGTDLGTTALPFGNLWLGTVATNNFRFQAPATAGPRVITWTDPLANSNLPFTNNTDTTATHVLHATATAGLYTSSAIATGDLPTAIPIGNVGTSGLSGTAPVTINAAGAIGCATCVTSAAALTSNAVVIGGGGQASSTISADTTTTHALFATGTAPAFRALATGDMPATVVQTGQVNTGAAAMTLNMAASTTANSFVAPAQAGLTSGTNGAIAYDTTNNNTHIRTNAADSIAVAEAAALAANVIPKQTDATHGLVTTSLITDDGTTARYTGTGGIRSDNDLVLLTTDFTDANAAGLQAVTGLNFTLVANTVQNRHIDCNIMWSQATNVADTFGVQDVSLAPTRIDAYGTMSVAGPAAVLTNSIYGVLTNLTTTTATGIVTATPTVTTVNYADLHITVQQPSGVSSVLQIMVQQATAADVIVVKAGSSCHKE